MKTLFHSADGLGDVCLVTAVAHNYYRITGHRMPFCSSQTQILRNNPHVDLRFSWLRKICPVFLFPSLLRTLGWQYVNLSFTGKRKLDNGCEVDYLLPYNMVLSLAIPFAVPGEYLVTPEFFLDETEKKRDCTFKGQYIVLNYQGIQEYKTWDYDKAAALASMLHLKGYQVIQTGGTSDKLLPDVIDLRGKTSIRKLASILYNARLYIGPIGGVMHIARAVGCPSVIFFSGAESAEQMNYDFRYVSGTDCTFCRDQKIDPYSMCINDCICTRNISFDSVKNAVLEELGKAYHRLAPVLCSFDQKDIDRVKKEISYVPSADVFKITLFSGNFHQRKHFFAGIPESAPAFFSDRELKGNTLCFQLSSDYIYTIKKIFFLDSKYRILGTRGNLFEVLETRHGHSIEKNGNCFVFGSFRTDIFISFAIPLPAGSYGVRLECSALPASNADFKENFHALSANLRFCELLVLLKITARELLKRILKRK